jgi:aspartate aminotransferase
VDVSKRIKDFQASPIRRLSPLARQAEERGIKVYHLNIGQPDIKTPKEAIKAIRAYNNPIIAYGPSEGIPELLNALPSYYRKYGLDIDSSDILITTGGSEALMFSFLTLCDPGDEIILPEPFYTNVASFARMAEAVLVPVTSTLDDAFALPSIETIEQKITSRTKVILICNPNNPTGYIYSREELLRILEICKRHDIFLMVDEVYREFCYDGAEFISVLSFTDYKDRVIVTDSFSKRYSMCGSRVGSIISKNHEVLAAALKLGQARLCPPDLEQRAAVAALLNTPDSYVEATKLEYLKRRNCLFECLSRIPGVKCTLPKGAFYMVAQLPVEDTQDFAAFLLRDFSYNGATVMVAPADGFYITKGLGKNQVRLAYVLTSEDLKQACLCLEKGLEAYNRN